MATFTDAQDRTWKVFIDIPIVKKLKQHDLDILNFFANNFEVFEKIVGDPVRLVDTLWLVCEDQVNERGMDEVGFAKALHGDALMSAAEALVEGVCDFFPDPKRRASLRAVFRKSKEAEGILLDNAIAQIEALDVSEMAKAMETESIEKSGVSPGSSE